MTAHFARKLLPVPAPKESKEEQARIQAVRELRLLDTPAHERFDRFTRIAKSALGTEIALVSLIDSDRQWFKSAQGIGVLETPREISFCGHAILGDEIFVVPDASKDERFSNNPLVMGGPKIRFYAGSPLRGPTGHRVGTLCVIDSKPRQLNFAELAILRDLASMVEGELRIDQLTISERTLRKSLNDAEIKATLDPLTHMWNRGAILELLEIERQHAEASGKRLGVAMVDIDHFKAVNDEHGHVVGDRVIAEVAARMRHVIRDQDFVGRYGGEEFLIVLEAANAVELRVVVERIRRAIAVSPIQHNGQSHTVTISAGLYIAPVTIDCSNESMVEAADKALYKAKRKGRNCTVVSERGDSMFPPPG